MWTLPGKEKCSGTYCKGGTCRVLTRQNVLKRWNDPVFLDLGKEMGWCRKWVREASKDQIVKGRGGQGEVHGKIRYEVKSEATGDF